MCAAGVFNSEFSSSSEDSMITEFASAMPAFLFSEITAW
jgi:hypothetical protein